MVKQITPYQEGAKTMTGKVLRKSADKTVVIQVSRRVMHPMGKQVTLTSRFSVHDEHNECEIGATIRVYQVRPISKTKNWCYLPENRNQKESS